MRVLVTGANGLIANRLIPEIISLGHTVICTGRQESLSFGKPWLKKVSYIRHDMYENTSDDLVEKFGYPDAVIHLAWDHLDDFNDRRHIDETYPAHKIFLTKLITGGVKRIACLGSCLEYGLRNGVMKEDDICNPLTYYGRAKLRLYHDIKRLCVGKIESFMWIRLFYIYSYLQSPDTLFGQILNAANNDKVLPMSPGDQLRDYLLLDRACQLIGKIMQQEDVVGVINCCSGIPIAVQQFVYDRLDEIGTDVKIKLGVYEYPTYEPKDFWGSTKKLDKVLMKQ